MVSTGDTCDGERSQKVRTCSQFNSDIKASTVWDREGIWKQDFWVRTWLLCVCDFLFLLLSISTTSSTSFKSMNESRLCPLWTTVFHKLWGVMQKLLLCNRVWALRPLQQDNHRWGRQRPSLLLSWSPSSIMEVNECPQSFLFQIPLLGVSDSPITPVPARYSIWNLLIGPRRSYEICIARNGTLKRNKCPSRHRFETKARKGNWYFQDCDGFETVTLELENPRQITHKFESRRTKQETVQDKFECNWSWNRAWRESCCFWVGLYIFSFAVLLIAYSRQHPAPSAWPSRVLATRSLPKLKTLSSSKLIFANGWMTRNHRDAFVQLKRHMIMATTTMVVLLPKGLHFTILWRQLEGHGQRAQCNSRWDL